MRIISLAVMVAMISGIALAEIGEPILIGKGRDPQWSPDESQIAFLQGDSLLIKRLDSPEEARHLYTAPILRYYWLDDSSLVTQERKMDLNRPDPLKVARIVRVTLTGGVAVLAYDSLDASRGNDADLHLERFADGSIGYHESILPPGRTEMLSANSVSGARESKPALMVGTIPMSWGKIWLYYGSKDVGRQITSGDNTFSLPRLAPSLDKIFCKNHRAELIVFDTLGNEIANLGEADMQSWDSRGEYIVFCETVYGHYDLQASDLWVAKYDGSEVRQLTDTPDIIETGGVFSPSSAYLAYRNGQSGEIFVVELR